MKYISFLFLILGFHFLGFTQTESIKWTPQFRLRTADSKHKIIYYKDNTVYINYKTIDPKKEWSNDKAPCIEIVNTNNAEETERIILHVPKINKDSDEPIYDGTLTLDDQVLVYFTEKVNKLDCYSYVAYFSLNGKILGTPELLFHYKGKTDYSSFRIKQSDSANLVYYMRGQVIFYRFIHKYQEGNTETARAFIHNTTQKGIRIYSPSAKDILVVKGYNNGEECTVLMSFDKYGIEKMYHKLFKDPEHQLQYYNTKLYNDTEIIAVGAYLDKHQFGIEGIKVNIIDIETGDVTKELTKTFTEEEAKSYITGTPGENESGSKRYYLPKEFYISKILVEGDDLGSHDFSGD